MTAEDDAPIECVIEDDRWGVVEGLEALCLDAVRAALAGLDSARPGAAVILFTSDETVQALNARFRGKDAPTNVLSFPAPESESYPGDIALAYDTCLAEAGAREIALAHHAAHLAVHGVLHLNGFDHQDEAEAGRMEALEIAALARIGVADPYQMRS